MKESGDQPLYNSHGLTALSMSSESHGYRCVACQGSRLGEGGQTASFDDNSPVREARYIVFPKSRDTLTVKVVSFVLSLVESVLTESELSTCGVVLKLERRCLIQ